MQIPAGFAHHTARLSDVALHYVRGGAGSSVDILVKDIRAVVEGSSTELPVSTVALARLLAARDGAYTSRK